MCKKYTFREITEKDELENFFKLRYDIYSDCRMNGFVKTNEHSIDIDTYDVHSRHYALLCDNQNAGYLRVVLPREEIVQEPVLELGRKYQLLNGITHTTNENAPYPFLSYNAAPKSYWNFYKSISKRNEKIVEASRLILSPEYRNIRSSKFLIECAMVLYIMICLGMKHAIISCFKDHAAFYKHYGFKEIDENGGYRISGDQISAHSLFLTLTLSSIPQKNHSLFQEMAEEYITTHKIEREF